MFTGQCLNLLHCQLGVLCLTRILTAAARLLAAAAWLILTLHLCCKEFFQGNRGREFNIFQLPVPFLDLNQVLHPQSLTKVPNTTYSIQVGQ